MGRQHQEWTGLEWNIILQRVENREEWRKLVVNYTVVPQWSARLQIDKNPVALSEHQGHVK